MNDESSHERQILAVMRKVLAQIIKDTTPPDRAMRHPLSASTIEDIRQCFALIAARERELADRAGAVTEKPFYTDERPTAQVIPIPSIKKQPPDDD